MPRGNPRSRFGDLFLPCAPAPPTFISGPGLQLCQKQTRLDTPYLERILKESKERKSVICPRPGQGEGLLPHRFKTMASSGGRQAQHASLGRHRKAHARHLAGGKCSPRSTGPDGHLGTGSGNKFSTPQKHFLFVFCFLSAAAGWRKVSEDVCLRHPKAASDPSFPLGKGLTTPRKGRGLAMEPSIVFIPTELSGS